MKNGVLQQPKQIKPISTFYLAIEDGLTDTIYPCYIENGGVPERIYFNRETERHMTLTEKDVTAAIVDNNVRLMVIDPLQAFLPEKTNMGNITKMREILTMLAKVAATTNTAIVLIGHLNKNEGRKAVHRGFGSADIFAAVRSVLLVYMDKHNNRYVKSIKSNFKGADYTPIALVMDDMGKVDFEPADIEEDPEPRTQAKKIETAKEIIREMLKDGPMPIDDVITACEKQGMHAKTARRARSELGARSYSKDGVMVWELPE